MIDDFLHNPCPETIATLKQCIETGMWPNNERLSAEQKEHCLYAVLKYEAQYTQDLELHYTPRKKNTPSPCATSSKHQEERPIFFSTREK